MRSFYHYVMRYRGIHEKSDYRKQLADWMFHDHDFPKQSSNYDELTSYLEMNSPFPEALRIFDELWNEYQA
ncbi:YozE family protein [Alkalibacillus aidingensis]|uniref:YozE family protein n=1 Tax=Alkalibacillus aidingensis TaxID=2747607 RepID=UPI00166059F2|nr:YozE family protein [Alkalibacillus aidingensis]